MKDKRDQIWDGVIYPISRILSRMSCHVMTDLSNPTYWLTAEYEV